MAAAFEEVDLNAASIPRQPAAFTAAVRRQTLKIVAQIGASSLADRNLTAAVFISRAEIARAAGQYDKAILLFTSAINAIGSWQNTAQQPELITAIFLRAFAYAEAGRNRDEILQYDDLIKLFEPLSTFLAQHVLHHALFNRAISLTEVGELERALSDYNRLQVLLERDERQTSGLLAETCLNKAVLFGRLGNRRKQAEAAERAVANFANPHTSTGRFAVAGSLLILGTQASESFDFDMAEEHYRRVVSLCQDASDSTLALQAVRAYVNIGADLNFLGRPLEALDAYNHAIALVSEITAPPADLLGLALLGQARQFFALGRSADAQSALDHIHALIDQLAGDVSAELIAHSAYLEAQLAQRFGEIDRALQEYQRSVDIWGKFPFDRPEIAAYALLEQSNLLSSIGRHEQALAGFAEVQRLQPEQTSWSALLLARSLLGQGAVLASLGRTADSVETYTELQAAFGDNDDPAIAAVVARALLNQAIGERRQGRHASAAEFAGRTATLASKFSDAELRRYEARGRLMQAVELGRTKAAIEAYEVYLDRHPSPEPDVLEYVAEAMFNRAFWLGELGECDEAISSYQGLVDRFGRFVHPATREFVAKAKFNLGYWYLERGNTDKAMVFFRELIEDFGDRAAIPLFMDDWTPADATLSIQAEIAKAFAYGLLNNEFGGKPIERITFAGSAADEEFEWSTDDQELETSVDPAENGDRARQGIVKVARGFTAKFSSADPDLIVQFTDRANRFNGGRILLVQQFLLDNLGLLPEIVTLSYPRTIATFSNGPLSAAAASSLLSLLTSRRSKDVMQEIGVEQIQYEHSLIVVPRANAVPVSFS